MSSIFSYIAEPRFDILEQRNQYYHDDNIHPFDLVRYVGRPGPFGYLFYQNASNGNLQLRLVCRAFNRAMTRTYFKLKDAVIYAWKANEVQNIRDFIMDETSIIAPFVSRLVIMLSLDDRIPSLFDLDRLTRRAPMVDDLEYQNELDLMNTSLRAFLPMLEDMVVRLPRLESIVVSMPEEWRSDGPAYPDSDGGSGSGEEKIEDLGPIKELDLLELVRISMATIFSSPRISLNFLTYLRLTLPSAYDFAIIGSKISATVASQLRHLYLEYIDGTGPGGDRHYTQHWQGDSDSEGDEDHPFSNLQNRFPNTAYMGDMCTLIGRCHNLESLGLHCTQPINLDLLDWRPNSPGLKNLYLARAITSADKLLSLLSPDAITAFYVRDVSLISGTWGSVFDRLCSSPSLIYVDVYNIIYDKYGESAPYAEHNNRPWENVSVMWSDRDEDSISLSDMIHAVQARKGKVSPELEQELGD
ncbi:hypothetical protein P154DRAFT_537704 [Amniculicola lignicola CBS 123094]|uniref:Uncharacterized protein n=1 Tax=Amniculicola lignicola CBS 123094 TaxID=1392246 RepID=A0A6A5W6Q3_9PLEO|nr:hypothetical protein P154DRAFT_537704 [Amniculicola lignicola CBS 123094]